MKRLLPIVLLVLLASPPTASACFYKLSRLVEGHREWEKLIEERGNPNFAEIHLFQGYILGALESLGLSGGACVPKEANLGDVIASLGIALPELLRISDQLGEVQSQTCASVSVTLFLETRFPCEPKADPSPGETNP